MVITGYDEQRVNFTFKDEVKGNEHSFGLDFRYYLPESS